MKLSIKNIFLLFLAFTAFDLNAQSIIQAKEAQSYEIKQVPIPDDVFLEVGGLAFDDQGNLGVCTRRGELWVISNPDSDAPTYSRFAHGFHESLGLAWKDGSYYLAQRPELTKVTDRNGDGEADKYETIYSWPLDGNYHEYSYGPLFLPDGNMLVTLNLGWVGRGISNSKWRGWMLQISPDGKATPIATGMRSPAAFGFNKSGDVFYAENQGDWVGSGRIGHVEKGDFLGNPEGLKWSGEVGSPVKTKFGEISDTLGYSLYEYAKVNPEIKPPSVWFPHTLMGISTSAILLIDNDKFGPFEGQMLVADQGHSKIMRVAEEKVKGVYQGAVFGFREGFSSGVLRLEWGPEKDLYVGMTSRGWASTGKDLYGLERLVYTGKDAFEMKAIRAMPDGFEVEFTEPANRGTAANPENYFISDFTYLYHHFYGSPVVDLENRAIYKIDVSQDGLKARLYVEGLREGFIYEIKTENIKSQNGGKDILHNTGYYTLNQIPDGEKMEMSEDHAHHSGGNNAPVNIVSDKRVTEMPSSWFNGPDEEITIGTKPGMLYDKTLIKVKAGSKIKLTFNNPDDMMHNLLVVRPKTSWSVGQAAMQLGLQGQQMGFIPPDSDDVLAHTTLLQPNSSDVIYFMAPTEPGDYEYVCTFPGHAGTMKGVLRVE